MNYKFPIINSLDQVRAAIAGRDEFIEADKGDYIVFNYLVNFEDTFPPVKINKPESIQVAGRKAVINHTYDEAAAIRRECRGLIMSRDGKVLSRRYHKFFNLGERVETCFAAVDFTQPHIILEKLDGSMITPFITEEMGECDILHKTLRWGTKMGETDVSKPVARWVGSEQNYMVFAKKYCLAGYTPIFEWCSRSQRIVVDHPKDRLVLTAIRENLTGGYVDYDTMVEMAAPYRIEVVKKLDLSHQEMLESLDTLEDAEGYVIRFEDGHMLKVKGAWYLQLHKTLEHIQHEKDLIRLILDDKLDDAKPFLPADLVEKLERFAGEMFDNMHDYAENLAWQCIEDYDRTKSKKDYALLVKDKSEANLRFKIYDFLQNCSFASEAVLHAYALVKEKVRAACVSQTKVNGIRHFIGGISWLASSTNSAIMDEN